MAITTSRNKIAVVTGATSGIGKAIAHRLTQDGYFVYGVGRRAQNNGWFGVEADLSKLDTLDHLFELLDAEHRLDVLVHSAGRFNPSDNVHVLNAQYEVNVMAPYYLTQRLFQLLSDSHGQVVFINSLAGLSVQRPQLTQYAATKHALKAIADGFRSQANYKNVRVTSVYLGKVATPMQEANAKSEGRDYMSENLMAAETVAATVSHILGLPRTAEITDITLRSTRP